MNAKQYPYLAAMRIFGTLLVGAAASVCHGVTFVDRTSQYFAAGHSDLGNCAAFGDYNGDGFVDLVAGNKIYRSNGGTSFVETSYSVNSTSLWGDVDNDGHLDVFSASSSRSLLLNNGKGGFTAAVNKLPSTTQANSVASAMADFNNDGYLDFYCGNYEGTAEDTGYPDMLVSYKPSTQNYAVTWQGSKDFYRSVGGVPEYYKSRGVTAADFDRDGDQDVYVSDYRLVPNRLLQNDGKGNFTDVAKSRGAAGTETYFAKSKSSWYGHTIGSCWGDLDNDGHLDLFVGNFRHNWTAGDDTNGDGVDDVQLDYQNYSQFLRNTGPSGGYKFDLKAELKGADWQESYGSPALADYDNDGDLDLFFTTVYEGADKPRLYRNDGNWKFTNVTDSVGLSGLASTYQAAWADVDNDGDLDLMTSKEILINDASTNGNRWLKVLLGTTPNGVNRSAIGAQVRVYAGNTVMTRQVEAGTGQGNQNYLTLHFGLGGYSGLVDVEVFWPNGETQMFPDIATNRLQILSVPEPSAVLLLGTGVIATGLFLARRRRADRRCVRMQPSSRQCLGDSSAHHGT